MVRFWHGSVRVCVGGTSHGGRFFFDGTRINFES